MVLISLWLSLLLYALNKFPRFEKKLQVSNLCDFVSFLQKIAFPHMLCNENVLEKL